MHKIHHVEMHYDLSGAGATITIVRPSIPGHAFTYTGRGYKYTPLRAERVRLATFNSKWNTRFLGKLHLITRNK